MGLQGAGKSTFYRQRFAATHALVSRDAFRSNPRPARRQRELVLAALAGGRPVVVDNTSPTPADRAAIVEVAREAGVPAVCFYFEPDVKASIARNAGREGKAKVPVVAILATRKRLVPPSPAEGFERLYVVRATAAGFDVAERDPSAPAPAVDASGERP